LRLVFLGPPGSGKGTQAVRLSQRQGWLHLSTGDILREAVKLGNELGRKAESFMKNGELVPDHLIMEMIRMKISSGALDDGFILDGFPRTIPQAEQLKELFIGNNISLDMVILLRVSDEEIVKRLSGRWFCPVCNAGYNYPLAVPKVTGRCDKDNAHLQRRSDDDEAVVVHRLEVYKRQTRPIEDFYRTEQLLYEIPAESAPDKVFQALLNATAV